MKQAYEALFTPWKIGNVEIKNRIVMCSMGGTSIFGWMEPNHFDKEAAHFLLERARNNVGLILPGIAPIRDPMGGRWLYQNPGKFKELKEFMTEFHKTGAKLFIQITAGFGRAMAVNDLMVRMTQNKLLGTLGKPIFDMDFILASASATPNRWADGVMSRPFTVEEIHQVVDAFAKTARLCQAAGVDGVEVHAVHEGYTLDQFATKYTNQRTDEYGGSLENRYRFATEIVQAIKKACGKEFPVSLRYSVVSKTKGFRQGALPEEVDFVEVGRDMAESEKAARLLQEAYRRGERLIGENKERLAQLVDYLLEVETADGRDVERLVKTGERPAPKPKAPDMKTSRVIAVDGPSGAGKSSVSRAVGQRLGFLHVDSGALYRIVTWQCLEQGVDTADPKAVAALAGTLRIDCKAEDGRIVYEVGGVRPDKELREPRINAHASPVATVPEVRAKITDLLRSLTRFGDLIVEGRDITTAVFPDTPARFFIEADPAVRAQRRQLEEVQKGVAEQTVEAVQASLLARDKIDSTRACAPLRKADGVTVIDSTHLTLEQVIQAVIDALPEAWKPAKEEAPHA